MFAVLQNCCQNVIPGFHSEDTEGNGWGGTLASNCMENLSHHQRKTPNTISCQLSVHRTNTHKHFLIQELLFFFFLLLSHSPTTGASVYIHSVELSLLPSGKKNSPWDLERRTWSRTPGWFWQWCAWVSPHWLYWSCPAGPKSATGLSWFLPSASPSHRPAATTSKLMLNYCSIAFRGMIFHPLIFDCFSKTSWPCLHFFLKPTWCIFLLFWHKSA